MLLSRELGWARETLMDMPVGQIAHYTRLLREQKEAERAAMEEEVEETSPNSSLPH